MSGPIKQTWHIYRPFQDDLFLVCFVMVWRGLADQARLTFMPS